MQQLTNLRSNDLVDPLAIPLESPRLSWEVQGDSKSTSAFRIETAFEPECFNQNGISPAQTEWIERPGEQSWILDTAEIQPLRQIFWRIQVRDEDGNLSPWSKTASFRFGLQEWAAKWICADWEGTLHEGATVPLFQKSFEWDPSAKEEPITGILSISALGAYDVFINGNKMAPDELGPGWTDYRKQVLYRAYDITSFLQRGKNDIRILLGDAWFCGHVGWGYRQVWGKAPRLMAQIHSISSTSIQLITATDESWKMTPSGILQSDLQMGEECDGKTYFQVLESDGNEWSNAKTAPFYEGEIVPAPHSPVIAQESLKPISIKGSLGSGNRILCDFGQNLVGRIEIELKGPQDAIVHFQYAERLDEAGEIYTENLRTAKNHDRYHLRGGKPESWRSRFTTHGFQYLELTCESAAVEMLEVSAVVLHNDLDLQGSFSCSHQLLNQLHQNTLWGQKGNFLEVPTDCPQRNERLGWTGDINVFMETALYHGLSQSFYRKWLRDMRDSQSEKGAIPPFIPWVPLVEENMRDGGPCWSDAHIHGAWEIYQHTGRKDLLETHYPSMVRYLHYILEYQTSGFIRMHNEIEWQGFGDWLAQDGGHGLAGNTPKDLIGTAFLAQSLREMAFAAGELGKDVDVDRFTEIRCETLKAFNQRFVTEEGLLASGTQTAYLLALKFDLLPEEKRTEAAKNLVRNIRERDWHLTTGFVGTPLLCEILASHGYPEDAYKLLEQTTYPAWLFPILNGATTIWERWDGWTPERGFQDPEMNSFNHFSLGAVVAWMFKGIAGIQPDKPGFKRILFAPLPGGSLDWAKAEVPTPYGITSLRWELTEQGLNLEIQVPVNTTGIFRIPSGFSFPNQKENERSLPAGNHKLSLIKLQKY